ncbi:CotH kinase family protein [Salinibacterium sp. NSLL150]|nr:CotH kinase family protein [Salinibacterium sp. NSLL35]MBH0101496.1 CotH kinase family protein [Salinibacterium sp. NSLL150]MBH0104255.1 CotH kinase family protein [Salinibacterium sp. NSLL16]MBH0107016.1 CotH kinase family protein [Salinibacterium sp. NSLL17]
MQRKKLWGVVSTTVVLTLTLASCSVGSTDTAGSAGTTDFVNVSLTTEADSFFDSAVVHSIEIDVDSDEVLEMVETYLDSGDKEWLEATVVIDGTTYEQVGIKLKGNSSLRGVTADTPIEELPWRIRLDKYVDGQSIEGVTDVVVRSNNTETSLNEAVALETLSAAGLASEESVATRFSVNGSEETLLLTVAVPNQSWIERNYEAGLLPSDDGILWKAESEGDYSWLGDDPELYTEVFDREAGDDDYEPLVDFLDVVNNTTDEEFVDQLSVVLDVESFARYLAVEDLIDNFDDIDGPGNNSYLYYDPDSGLMSVLAWDHNLAFGTVNEAGGGTAGGAAPEGALPEGALPEGALPEGELPEGELPEGELPEGERPSGAAEGAAPGGLPAGGGGDAAGGGQAQQGNNILTTRFTEIPEFAAMYEDALEELQAEIFESGQFASIVESRSETLSDEAADLVDSAVLESETEAILAYSSGEVQETTAGQGGAEEGTRPGGR